MITRKCRKCGSWNGENNYCSTCNYPVSPQALEAKKKEGALPEGPDLREIILEKARHSKYMLTRFFFYTIYGLFMIIIAIGAFFAYLTAFAAA